MRRRLFHGIGLAGASAATAAAGSLGQLLLARQCTVLRPGAASTDDWQLQLLLVAWVTAAAAILGCAAVRRWVREAPRRWALAVPAGLGALAGLPLARSWAAGATALARPVDDATVAVGVGAVVGAVCGAGVLAAPALARGAVAWAGAVWIGVAETVAWYALYAPGAGHVPPRLGGPDLKLVFDVFEVGPARSALELPVALALFAALGAWAARRRERLPVLGAVYGPLLTAALSGALWALVPGAVFFRDHPGVGYLALVWLLWALLGSGTAALAAWAVDAVRARRAARAARSARVAGAGDDLAVASEAPRPTAGG